MKPFFICSLLLLLSGALLGTLPAAASSPCPSAPAAPILIKPIDRATPKKLRVWLDWADTPCADRYELIVRLGSKQGGSSAGPPGPLTISEYRTIKLSSGATYFWRVKAKNIFGVGKSEWRRFTMQ